MTQRTTALEHAFEMAKSGRFAKVSELIRSLEQQGYDGGQIYGRILRRQLNDLIKATRNGRARSASQGEVWVADPPSALYPCKAIGKMLK